MKKFSHVMGTRVDYKACDCTLCDDESSCNDVNYGVYFERTDGKGDYLFPKWIFDGWYNCWND